MPARYHGLTHFPSNHLDLRTVNWFNDSKTCLIRNKGEVGASPPVIFFTDHSKAVLLLWMFFVIYVTRLTLLYCHVYSLQLCDSPAGKGLTSWLS